MQSLLKSHEKAENEIRSYSSEIDRLKELSRKVIEGSTTSTPHYVRMYISCSHFCVYACTEKLLLAYLFCLEFITVEAEFLPCKLHVPIQGSLAFSLEDR